MDLIDLHESMTMTIAQTRVPVRFDASMEPPMKDEVETAADLDATMEKIREKTFADNGHATRSSHAKAIGLFRGKLTVLDGLSAQLAQGIFTKPATFDVAMRLSTMPADILDDSVSTPRGLALKVLGGSGDRLPGSEAESTQDFVLVNNPAFFASSAKELLLNLKGLAATTDKIEGVKKAVSVINRGTEGLLEMFGMQSPMLQAMGGQAVTHPLGETYYSQAAILYGDYIAKVSVAPVSPVLVSLHKAKINLKDRPDGLRDEVRDAVIAHGGEWELRIQLCTNLDKMPIEDIAVVWSEEESPYIPVARIAVTPQDAWEPTSVRELDDGMSYSPWHGIAAHRPLGSVQRARKMAYEHGAQFRSTRNKCPVHS